MRAFRALGVSVLLLLLAVAPATAATQIGQTFVPNGAFPFVLVFQSATFTDQPSYAVPAGGGVITSWSHVAENPVSPPGATLKFIVMRASGPDFKAVGVTDSKTLAGGFLNKFDTQIPVQAGDLIGLRSSAATLDNVTPSANPANTLRYSISNADPATDQFLAGASLLVSPGVVIDVSATVEPDTDKDGFGDETQDACPTDASKQGPCPVNVVNADKKAPTASLSGSTKQDVAKQGSVDVVVTSSETGSASASGTLNVSGASKTFTLKPASATLAANVKTTLKLKLTKKTKKALGKALKKGKGPKASVTVLVKDIVGNATSTKRTIKVKKQRGRR